MMQKTPKAHVYKRPAKGGGVWEYVTGTYVKKVLNYTFGWNWDFIVKDHGVEGDTIWVLGELTVRTDSGAEIKKNQFGRADIKRKKNSTDYLDYGNDLKSATTDALKKCASELGIASDIYGAEEFKEINKDNLAENPIPLADDGDEPATETQIKTIQALDPTYNEENLKKLTKQEAINTIHELTKKNG